MAAASRPAAVELVGCGAGDHRLGGGELFAIGRPHPAGTAAGGHDRVDLHAGSDFRTVRGNQPGERLGEPTAATDGGGVAGEQGRHQQHRPQCATGVVRAEADVQQPWQPRHDQFLAGEPVAEQVTPGAGQQRGKRHGRSGVAAQRFE